MWWGGDDLEVEGGVAFQRVRRHTGRLRPRVVFGLVFAESTLIALVAQMAHTQTERKTVRERERDVCSHSRVATLLLHCAHCSQPSTRRERASASTLRLISCARTFKYLQWAFVLIALHIFS